MGTVDSEIAAAWQHAADDLGITVETLRSSATACDRRVPFAVWIKDFGSPKGTVCRFYSEDRHEEEDFAEWARAKDFFWSLLFDSYRQYDRELFIDTLNDWGWFGTESPPPWYSGQPWSADE